MGLFDGLFGGNPATNTGVRDAMIDHATEKAESGGNDPIPSEPPDWAADLPSPSDYSGK